MPIVEEEVAITHLWEQKEALTMTQDGDLGIQRLSSFKGRFL